MTLHNDLVSVVIPVYNSEKFLAQSIESVLNQTYKKIEIIVVDDGSTDQSLSILKKYSDKITIVSQPNQGLASALNTGIKHIKGKWLKWFSPDDVLYPTTIETLVNKTKQLPKNTILYSNWDIINENGIKLRNFSENNYNNLTNFEFNIRLLDGQQINVNTTLIPSSLLSQGCLIKELEDPVVIDYDFFLRAGILFNTKFYLISKYLIMYRIQKNQLSHKHITSTLSYLPKVRQDVLSQLDQPTRNKYISRLKEFQKNKSIHKKSMELGLKITNLTLPNFVTERMLVFYLNKIRSSR